MRSPSRYVLPPGAVVLCIDIGGTSTKLGVFELPDRLRPLETIPSRGPAEEFGKSLTDAVRRGQQSIREQQQSVAGVGLAVAGFLNDERDRMIYNPNLAWLEGYPLRTVLMNECNVVVALEVDSNAAALAEYHLGIGYPASRFLCLTIGTGLGVGMIVDGHPLRFAYGCMGDAGHVVVQPNGPLCACGGRGCAEVLVSAPLLAEEFRIRMNYQHPCSLRNVIEAANEGNPTGIAIIEHAAEWLGVATASLANIFYPDLVAFAGGLAEAGELLLSSIRKSFAYSASTFTKEHVTLARAALGSMATLNGAAYSILDRLDESAAPPAH